ncbi:hypothetical protein AAFC00_003641 [Neodothiora populina]|uniref:Ino eighty subunit 1 n=1 Tax=Neodothiora populina TaxID=2781224 RepID=A0ABR3PFC7_9PEZI
MSSLKHILADEPEESARPTPPTPTAQATIAPAAAATPNAQPEGASDENGKAASVDETRDDADAPHYTSTTQTTRRNANGSVSSVYSGNKIRHLKKEDGIPLWRKDIQYEFLCLVFHNEQKVFTRYSDGKEGFTFADIYIDAMSKSSKCSKILKEKLAQDVPSAITMAMVCLLVNVGRMNTTLNFFPEMRAQLRTYHSIPALQARQDPNAYKQLQDAPRLKSILKGATEDSPQPGTIEEIKAADKPRTNPVNLIFVLAQYAPKISELHFHAPRDFFDLVMRPTLSSKSRANAFLWLMWHYLESDFARESVLQNPFGRGGEGPGSGGMPIKVPDLEALTEEEAERENVDTMSEEEFGDNKRKERLAIVASEPSPAMTALKRARKGAERSLFATGGEGSEGVNTPSRDFHSPVPGGEHHALSIPLDSTSTAPTRPLPVQEVIMADDSTGSAYSHDDHGDGYAGSEHTRSPSPPASGFQAINRSQKTPGTAIGIKSLLSEDDPAMNTSPAAVPKKGPGRGNWRRSKGERSEPQPILPNTPSFGFVHESPAPNTPGARASPSASISFQPLNIKDHIPTPSYQSSKRSRPLTSHQQAVSDHRRTRVNSILDLGHRTRLRDAKKKRYEEGPIVQAWKRIKMLPDGWDSEEDSLDKPKEDSKDKDKDDNGKNKVREEEKAAAALRKAGAGTRTLGGFRLPRTDKEIEREKARDIFKPDPEDDDDYGEQAIYYADGLRRFYERMEVWDERANKGAPLREPPERKIPYEAELEKEDQELDAELTATLTPRPRQARKRATGAAAGRKSKGGASTPAGDGKKGKRGARQQQLLLLQRPLPPRPPRPHLSRQTMKTRPCSTVTRRSSPKPALLRQATLANSMTTIENYWEKPMGTRATTRTMVKARVIMREKEKQKERSRPKWRRWTRTDLFCLSDSI